MLQGPALSSRDPQGQGRGKAAVVRVSSPRREPFEQRLEEGKGASHVATRVEEMALQRL